MNIAELKLEVFRKIDSLDKKKLEEIYGILMNYLNSNDDSDEWEKLSEEQQKGIIESIYDLEKDHGIPHNKVMEKYRKKYNN